MLATARQTLSQAVARYSTALQSTHGNLALAHQSAVKTGLNQLQSLNTKLEAKRLNVAVFGLVSRGKSAVINALVEENAVETGPLHGVTRWPRSVYWQIPPGGLDASGQAWQIELVDTPGLDEVGGEVRSDMSQTVAQQADLILFVVAGDITQKEYDALAELKGQQKPLLLVFNKTDLYPEVDRQAVYKTLEQLRQTLGPDPKDQALAVDEVIMVAASPAPIQVRVEWPDGRVAQAWETPEPQIAPLKQALITIIRQDGPALVALNALRQAHTIEQSMVSHVSELYSDQADNLIWQFAKYKAIAVALNPVAVLDVLGGIASDLVMIRNLARLYGFPITSYEAGRLWQAILKSSGALLLSEAGSAVLGAGKTTAALFSLVDSPSGIAALAGAVTAQASAAGYGTFAVGKAAKLYLERGCTWGPEGISATMAEILGETNTSLTLARLRHEIQTDLLATSPKQSVSRPSNPVS
jgi:small GTP-binding protein